MNSLILSFFVAIIFLFHKVLSHYIRRGKVKEGFCALWCMDAVFAICGTIISFQLYHYSFRFFFSPVNFLWIAIYLLVTFLFLFLAPSGLSLLLKKRTSSEEEILLAEYRFHDMAGLIRNCLFLLLFVLPILFTLCPKEGPFHLIVSWKESDICGGFCFAAFILLLPLSLRQVLFWLKHLAGTPSEAADKALRQYSIRLRYHQKNRFL
ncbi:MAG: hypothetical protein ACI4TB_07545 [Lachnospiraceae bacterium]